MCVVDLPTNSKPNDPPIINYHIYFSFRLCLSDYSRCAFGNAFSGLQVFFRLLYVRWLKLCFVVRTAFLRLTTTCEWSCGLVRFIQINITHYIHLFYIVRASIQCVIFVLICNRVGFSCCAGFICVCDFSLEFYLKFGLYYYTFSIQFESCRGKLNAYVVWIMLINLPALWNGTKN